MKVGKRVFLFFMTFSLLIGLGVPNRTVLAATGQAEPEETEVRTSTPDASDGTMLADWEYTETADTVTLNKYIGTSTDVIVPGSFEGKRVVIHGSEDVFADKGITSLVIGTETGKVVCDNAQVTKLLSSLKDTLVTADLRGLDVSNVTNMSFMFSSMKSLTELSLSGWETANVIYMNSMFASCDKLTILDLTNFDTRNVIDMGFMFFDCGSLKNVDVTHFDTENVINMEVMFSGCKSLTSLDVTHFNTKNVTNMMGMFWGCKNLTSLDIQNFDTKNVTTMGNMFEDCSGFTSLDVSNLDITKVKDAAWMFMGCDNIHYFDLSAWGTVYPFMRNMEDIFKTKEVSDIPTVIISKSKGFERLVTDEADGRIPYTVPIIYQANGGVFDSGKDVENVTLDGELVYSSVDEYKTAFSRTQKEVIDMADVPARAGATFNGWYLDQDCTIPFEATDEIVDFTMGNKESLTLYAGWDEKEYVVKYDTQGGSTVSDKTVHFTDADLLPSDVPTKTGYTFTGWLADGKAVDSTTTYESLAANDTVESITLTAQWTENHYTVKYDTGFEDIKIPDKENVTWNDVNLIPDKDLQKEGYTFKGWEIDGRKVLDTDKYGDLTQEDTDGTSVTLTAKWEKDSDQSVTKPDSPDQSDTKPDKNGTAVATGDNTEVMLFALLAAGAVLLAGAAFLLRKKSHR